MTPQQFIAKWKQTDLSERSACQQHFLDLCEMLGQPKPTGADPTGEWYTFEYGVEKTDGGKGFADVWMQGKFGWEYKGKHENLNAAYQRLLLYREALENPPLLVVCDLNGFEIHTNFTGTVKKVHAFDLDGLADPANIKLLRCVFTDPDALKPGQTQAAVTKEVADCFARLGDSGPGVPGRVGAEPSIAVGPLECPAVTIGVLTALTEEYAACRGIFDPNLQGVEKDFLANNGRLTFWLCRLNARHGGQHVIAIARTPDMGNISGAIAASLLLQCCPEMRYLVICGIAGAVPHPHRAQDHVRLGDIVVTNRDGVIHFDFGKRRDPPPNDNSYGHEKASNPFASFELRSPPRPPCPHLLAAVGRVHADEELLSPKQRREWEKSIDSYLEQSSDKPKWKRPPAAKDKLIDAPDGQGSATPHPKDDQRRSGVPRVFHGRIGSGNGVLADPIMRDNLRDNLRIKAVEMEGAGLADASWTANVGYLVIRGTCDYCNSTKNDEWHHYAALIAAAYARTVLEYLHPRPSVAPMPVSSTVLPAFPQARQQSLTVSAEPVNNPPLLNSSSERGQLLHQRPDVSPQQAEHQVLSASRQTGQVQTQSPATSEQVNEASATLLARNKVESLVDQIHTLLKAGRNHACGPLATQLEQVLRSLPPRGTRIKDGWIVLARLEDHRLHRAKQDHQKIDVSRLRSLYKEAENVTD